MLGFTPSESRTSRVYGYSLAHLPSSHATTHARGLLAHITKWIVELYVSFKRCNCSVRTSLNVGRFDDGICELKGARLLELVGCTIQWLEHLGSLVNDDAVSHKSENEMLK